MSRPESRSGNASTPQGTSVLKADDGGSGQTPGGSTENSVAYRYVAVQQMTSCRDHIEYQLTVREQPKQSRMCGVGEKADRRPIDPAPIVQLRVVTHDRPIRQSDPVGSASVAPPVERRPGQGAAAPQTPGVRRGLPVTTALGDGWEDKAWYLENPYYFMYAMLCNADTDEELHLLNDGKTRYTSGSCVSCLYHLKDIDGSHQGFFVFPDLSIRVEGRYRLKLCLFETIGHSVHHCKSIYSDPFHVYTAKRFPGMEESTRLSKSFAEQGLKVRVRKHPRSRRRGSKRTKDESDASDETPLARHVSPKRARASDVLPMSGLPMSQPIASSRMPRSMDDRFERADYDRTPSMASAYYDVKGAPPSRHAPWEEEEVLRLRESRAWDPMYDAPSALYSHHAREDRVEDRRLPPRDFADGRYMDGDYPPHTRSAAAPLSSMSARAGPSEYSEHVRSVYLRDDPVRSKHGSPHRLSAALPPLPPPLSKTPSHPALVGRGYPESSASLTPAYSRNYPSVPAPAPAPAPMPMRPAPLLSRSYDHIGQQSSGRIYDDYGPRPNVVAHYSGSYDPRDALARGFSPPSPQPGRRSPYASHHPPTQWRSGPPSPSRPSDYHLGRASAVERGYAAARRSPIPSARGIDTPPEAYAGFESNPFPRRSFGVPDAGRPAATYDAPRAPPADLYAPDEGPPSGRLGGIGFAPSSRERLILPPLPVPSPLSAHRGELTPLGTRDRDREAAYIAMPRDRDQGLAPTERYLSPSGYNPRAGELDQRDREWEWECERERERERERKRGPASPEYRRDFAQATMPSKPSSRGHNQPY